jgi:hypothetical protein
MLNPITYLLLSAVLSIQAAPDATAAQAAEARSALVGEMQAFALAHGKYDDQVPAAILVPLKLNGGKPGYAECLVAWEDDDDNSYHIIIVGLDKQDVVLAYKPADNSYSLDWRLNPAGELIATARSDKSGAQSAPNDLYADRLSRELDYWKVHLADEEKARAGKPPCTPPA